jgi:TolB protein
MHKIVKKPLLLVALLAVLALAVAFMSLGQRATAAPVAIAAPSSARESAAAWLKAQGYEVIGEPSWAGAQAVWQPPAAYRLFFAARAGESVDIYTVEARVEAQGQINRLGRITRLTETPHGEESAPLTSGEWLVYTTRAAGRYQTITCLSLRDLQSQEQYVFSRPPEQVSLRRSDTPAHVYVQIEDATRLAQVAIDLDQRRAEPEGMELAYLPVERGEMPWLPNLVSRIRELPGVGPEKIAFLENVFFTAMDQINRWRHALQKPTPTLPASTVPPTVQPLPDLLIQSVKVELDQFSNCMLPATRLGVRVRFKNDGPADAASFVVEVNGVQQIVEGLAAGQERDLWFAGYPVMGQECLVIVDAALKVAESDESNNRFAQLLPIPTPLPTCTPVAPGITAAPSPSPTPTFTARPSPSPTPAPTGQPIARGIARMKSVKPDLQRPFAEADVIELDPTLLQLKMIAGTTEPRSTTGLVGTGIIPQADWGALVGAFNGGFAAMHGQYGMMVDRKIYLPARDGLATIALYEDGTMRMGTWGKELAQTPDMLSYRQNCPPLIENGAITAETGKLALWGLSVSDEVYLYRSGLGVTAEGKLLYVAGRSLSAYTLARAMQLAGAVYAMQLDIDEYHVVFVTYDVQQADGALKVTGKKLRPDMHGYDSFFLRPFQLDFFYLTQRSQPLANALRLAQPTPTAAAIPTAAPLPRELSGRIAFASNRDGNWELYAMPAGQPEQVQRLTNHPADDLYPAWSPDGKMLAFASRRDGNAEIYTLTIETGELRRITNQTSEEWLPSWSPDGKRLAYQSDRHGQSDIYVCALDGSNEARLTNMVGNHEAPHWSPDGKSLAFDSDAELAGEVSNVISVNVMGVEGGDPKRLTLHGEYPRWSPDGKQIAFMIRSVQWQLFTINAQGGEFRQLTTGGYDARYPTWSPDGKWLAFSGNQDGTWELYIAPTEGGAPIRLTVGASDNTYPVWGP